MKKLILMSAVTLASLFAEARTVALKCNNDEARVVINNVNAKEVNPVTHDEENVFAVTYIKMIQGEEGPSKSVVATRNGYTEKLEAYGRDGRVEFAIDFGVTSSKSKVGSKYDVMANILEQRQLQCKVFSKMD